MEQIGVTRKEFDQNRQDVVKDNGRRDDAREEEARRVSSHTVILEGRVSRLEEIVNGEMGIVQTLKGMQIMLQDVRDTLNKQALLIPIATAAITATIVALITRYIK